ncbi:unnamed protein product (macronuclear) [Paramecium tetraurelia]|uniref:Uncharacterized protein n=1 Tax=Paramecium tetraurelia TaxID=5888 RepID=A0E1B6_PARTE|nr:uncharacterized protein GSPATT00022252001 [Paramecium tetraurelia]CAK89083.1 unnamed protein product [Paramecium tetraurelia]|eukprot:XP_001456480.1 hypothetical protein (macronuclear) [Paramecium tetraurelia strain d4-2]
MAYFQIDCTYLMQQYQHHPHQFHNRSNIHSKESIQQDLQSLLQFNYHKLLQVGDRIKDVTESLQKILDQSNQLKEKFEQSQKLQQKLQDIEEDLQSYFKLKESFKEMIEDYQSSLAEYYEMRKKVKEINLDHLPQSGTQNLLQEYATLTKKLEDYTTFENDLKDLKKIEERFEILELEEDYLNYYLTINNKDKNQILDPSTQLLSRFVQLLGQSINYLSRIDNQFIILESHQNCPVIVCHEDRNNMSEEVLMQFQYAIILKTYEAVSALIIIDKEKSEAQVICTSQNRVQNKQYLENYKNYIANVKISYTLLKQEVILESIYKKIIEKLVQFNMITQIGNLTFSEMQEAIKSIILYQQDLEQLDTFQFLDTMQIELN